jgi:hypothetical protein
LALIRDVARASLYRAQINLWVEDDVTRTYLSEVWNNPAVAFLIGGGHEGVQAIVKDAEAFGFANVFALIDRDFRQSNRTDWVAPSRTFRTFVLRVHEIENHLLDATALASIRLNNSGKTLVEIETMMSTAASRLCWWAACRDVVAELRKRFRDGFLNDPSCDVDTEVQATDHIVQSPWFQKLPTEVARSTETDVGQLLLSAHGTATLSLSDGSWKDEFAGKEILRDIGSRICDRTKFSGYNPTKAEFDADLAKEIGAWQRQSWAVPPDLVELLQALQLRIARPSSGP